MNVISWFSKTPRGTRRRQSAGSIRLETLEARCLLASDGAVLLPDVVTVHQNQSEQRLELLKNDRFDDDYAGERLISSISFGSQGGYLRLSDDRRAVLYAPPADFAGTEQFTYFVDGKFFANVDVKVQPAVLNDVYSLAPDGRWHVLNVMDNDPFWSGYTGARRISSLSVSNAGAELRIGADGRSVEYQSPEDLTGRDEFVYIVDGRYPGRVSIEVPPTLQPDRFELLQNSPSSSLPVLNNDPFWAGYSGARAITWFDAGTAGATISVSDDGKRLLYTPAEDAYGYDRIRYVVDQRYESWVDVIVHRPVNDDYYELDQDSREQSFAVLDNDQYRDLQYVLRDVVDRVTAVEPSVNGGAVRVSASGTGVVYSPPAGFSGVDEFTYIAEGRYPATVRVNVTRPVRDDYLSAIQDTPGFRLYVLANDFLGNGYTGPKQITSVSETDQGAVVVVDGGAIRYTPPENYVGSDTFTYRVDDTLEARVQVNVQPLADYDHYSFCADPNRPIRRLSVLSNDRFGRGYPGPALITSVETLTEGSDAEVWIAADQQALEYRAGSSSYERIRYTVDDRYTTEVTVWIQGHLEGDFAVADQNSDAVVVDVLANDFQRNWTGDACRSSLYTGARRITSAQSSVQGGSVTVSPDGLSVLYQPPADYVGADSFVYVVDGVMQASVGVQVVRRVRDDVVRVTPTGESILEVLVNDMFGADYRGAQRITQVTETAQGGQVRISDDGRQLIYQPPAGYVGDDSLTYTVDGRLKAEVTIQVRPDETPAFDRFETLDQFEAFLLEDALKRYENLFGQPYWSWDYDWRLDDAMAEGPAVQAPPRDHSETNVQVEGVDEGDIVEFDSDFVYLLTGPDLVILNAWPAESLGELSRTPIEGEPIAEFLRGDRLTIISQKAHYGDIIPQPWIDGPVFADGMVSDAPIGRIWYPYPIVTDWTTIVTVLDVQDAAQPTLVQRTEIEGQYVQSRAIGDFVYVVTTDSAAAPLPQVIPDEVPDPNPDDPRPAPTSGTYETKDQYVARFLAETATFVQDALPNYESYGRDGELARTGLLHEPEEIYRPLTTGASNLVSLVSIDVTNSEPGLTRSAGVYTNGATKVYASLDHFYVFEDTWDAEDGQATRILKFDWDAETGKSEFAAAGYVPGLMLNQFSADEHAGYLRIATSVSHSGSGNWTGVGENQLYVLRDDAGVLEFVGSLQNLALDESIQSVRFMGDRAMVVTFRQVDPLFGLDLSDPANPRSVGHLTLPGFSSYMQWIDDTHLLTVGVNTPGVRNGPVQVTLFDVSDLTSPVRLDEYTFERFSTTEANFDHHAFGYFASHDILAVPSTRVFAERVDEDQDGYREATHWITEYDLVVFRIDPTVTSPEDSQITLLATLSHDSPVRRSGYIADKLYSIAEDSVHVVDVAQPDVIIATASDLKRQPEQPEPDGDPVWMAGRLAAVDLARADLAESLTVSPEQVLMVAAEPSNGGWKTVLRVDDHQYLYDVVNDDARLLESLFSFDDVSLSRSWQNATDPFDVNGDGEVSPGDAILLVNQLRASGSQSLAAHASLRQIDSKAGMTTKAFWDVNGDGYLSPIDSLLVIDELNRRGATRVDLNDLDLENPPDVVDQVVDEVFNQILSTAGDANLDGVFNSSDFVRIFLAGEYEDEIAGNSRWSEGDWNGDREFTSADIVLAFLYGNYSQAASPTDIAFAMLTDANHKSAAAR